MLSGAKNALDANKYLEEQSRFIMERASRYDKLYLEVGGKLIDDLHAMRVLPGFRPDIKMDLFAKIKDQCEVLICIYSGDIERNKIRGDYGINYENEVFRLIDEFRTRGLLVKSVVITRYNEQSAVKTFINKLEHRGLRAYTHQATKGYPTDVDTICSKDGYGKNTFIETEKPIVIVTAPGPNSGKLATCLSQLYHENERGNRAGYSKFETFPIWNLPLKHPVNVAYEAATADLMDVNMIDPFHLEYFGQSAVNYNRDVEAYPLLKRILSRVCNEESIYHSPTEMGVNRAGCAIVDDELCREAANQEIIRRYFKAQTDFKLGLASEKTVTRCKLLMEEMQLSIDMRRTVAAARTYAEEVKNRLKTEDPISTAAIELADGRIITGRGSENMTAISAMLLNAIKALSGIDDKLHLLSPVILEPLVNMKGRTLGLKDLPLDSKEVLIALAMSASTNTTSALAMEALKDLKTCQAHSTVLVNKNDNFILGRLGIDISSDPIFPNERLFSDY